MERFVSGPVMNDNDCTLSRRDFLEQLKADMASINEEGLKRQVEAFRSCLESGLANSRIEAALPGFYRIREGDELYLEWIFDRCRFGFDFFNDENESAWFALIKRDEGMSRYRSKFNGDYRKAVDYALTEIARDCERMRPHLSCQEHCRS